MQPASDKPTVFVVQAIPERVMQRLCEVAEVEVFPRLDRQISLQETIDGARRADYLFALHGNYVPAAVIEANPNLRGIAVLGDTTVKVDFEAALACKVPIVTTRTDDLMRTAPFGGNPQATADMTVAMLLCLAYRVVEADGYTRQSETFQEQTMALMGIGCPGKTAGLIGLGKVAKHMVPRLRAFDMRLVYTKRTRLAPEEEQRLGLEWVSMDELLRESDYVCVEVDYNESTHELLGAREFGLMKPTAYLINTARGRILDEAALIRALQDGTIAGAALDVFYNEPPMRWDPFVPEELRAMSNVVLAPHNGGATYDSRTAQMMPLAEGIAALIRGERPRGLLNPEIYGEAPLYPQFYGRGPIVPVAEGGPANFPVL
jgi:glyoxylate reductase